MFAKEYYAHSSRTDQNAARDSLAQKQLQRFGLTMLVLAVSLVLYYFGFFGTYQGPLHPAKIGNALDGLGLQQWHFVYIPILLSVLSLTWNWVANCFCRATGRRLACLRQESKDSLPCARSVRKQAGIGQQQAVFVCSQGHQETAARFCPLKKGPWSYVFGLFWLLIAVLVFTWT